MTFQREVRAAVDLPDAVDIVDLLLLLCVKDENNGYCYYELERPILRNDYDPVSITMCHHIM